MAGDYDGTTFIALDSDRAGDGQADATTVPVTAALENLIESDHEYLRRRTSSRLCFSPWQTRGAERPLTSAGWTSPWMMWVDLTPADSTIRITAVGSGVTNDDINTTGEIQVRVELIGFADGEQGVVAETRASWDEGGAPYTVDLDISDAVEAPMSGILRVWVRSGVVAATNVSSGANVQTSLGIYLEPGGIANDISAKRLLRLGNISGDPLVDPVHLDLNDLLAIQYRGGYGGGPGYDVDVVEASYLQVETWIVEVDVDPAIEEGLWVVKHPVEMEPQSPVKGQHVVAHPKRSDAIYERPRIAAIGPSGRDAPNTDAAWPAGHFPQWTEVDGSGGVIDEMSIRVDGAPCRIEYRMLFASIIQGDGEARNEISEVQRERVNWPLNATVSQLMGKGETWASAPGEIVYGSTSRTVERVDSYYTTPWVRWPILQQMHWAHRAGPSLSPDWQYTYREGQLYEADLELLHPVNMVVDVSADVDVSIPVRLSVDVDALTLDDFIDWPSEGAVLASLQQTTWLVCVASQATVYPRYA